MQALRLFTVCVLRSRCPCCEQGALFEGGLRFRAACPLCGLVFDQWAGEWITPTYLASSVGMLVGFGVMAVILVTGVGMAGPLPPELAICALACGAALLALRPAKAGWLAVLYGMGGVEVSARTRAYLRWVEARGEASLHDDRLGAAERRARSLGAASRAAPARRTGTRSLRDRGQAP